MKKRNGHAESPEQVVTHLKELITEAQHLVGDTAGDKVEAMRERLGQAQERLQELYESARDKVVAGAKSTDATIRAHPYESLAVALGVGVLIGALVRRNSNH
jgi:ElaB/YqjD/DUF883 family membrane-anchored ribosome-binding protein